MNRPKQQHVIPRLHLQHFAGEDGRVWTYDALKRHRWPAIPEETATEQHFYSVERDDGTMDTRLEDLLARIEDRAAPTYQAVLSGDIPDRSSQARMDFAHFLGLMFSRTRPVRRQAATLFGQTIQSLLYAHAKHSTAFASFIRRFERGSGRILTEGQRRNLREGILDPSRFRMTVYKEAGLPTISLADKLAPIFFTMHWWLLTAGDGYYVTSDHPVVREIAPGARDEGFMTPTVEVTIPLSARKLLLMTRREVEYAKEIPRDAVVAANEARAQNSDQYLYAHCNDEAIAELAEKYRESRAEMRLYGLRPEKFAAIRVARRRPKEK